MSTPSIAPPTSESPAPDTGWPLTVVARLIDPGYSEREIRWWATVLLGSLWMIGSTIALEGRLDRRLLVVALLVGGLIGWQWLRRRPTDFEVVLEPDRLRVRDLLAGTPAVQIPRQGAGALLAAETGPDWRERLVLLTDDASREVLRCRASTAALQFRNTADASESWWGSNMPPGTSPQTPPSVVSAPALLGAWWPRLDQRWSVRGSLSVRRPWKEGDLATYAAWDRRQRRQNGLLLAGLLLFVYGLAIVATWPSTVAEAVEFLPPGIVGLALAVRSVLR